MTTNMSKRGSMVFYTSDADLACQAIRMVLAEKDVIADLITIDVNHKSELLALNPAGSVPTFVDRDLVLMDPCIILEYLDERYPHPPLMPVYPVARAKSRLVMSQVLREWYPLFARLEKGGRTETVKQELKMSLVNIIPACRQSTYFLSEEFSLVDCCFAPLIWRLSRYGLDTKELTDIKKYGERIFNKASFRISLNPREQESLLEA